MANNEDVAWSETEDADECVVRVEEELEAALEGGSGNAVQPIQQSVHEDERDEGVVNTVGEKGVQVDDELGRGKRAKYSSTRYHDFVTHTIRKISPSKNSSATSSFLRYALSYNTFCEL